MQAEARRRPRARQATTHGRVARGDPCLVMRRCSAQPFSGKRRPGGASAPRRCSRTAHTRSRGRQREGHQQEAMGERLHYGLVLGAAIDRQHAARWRDPEPQPGRSTSMLPHLPSHLPACCCLLLLLLLPLPLLLLPLLPLPNNKRARARARARRPAVSRGRPGRARPRARVPSSRPCRRRRGRPCRAGPPPPLSLHSNTVNNNTVIINTVINNNNNNLLYCHQQYRQR